MKVTIRRAKRKDWGTIFGVMGRSTMATGLQIKFKAMDFIVG
jgi:hypothetical protein